MQISDLFEAATPYGDTFWFNPATRQSISCSDHGDAVAANPSAFGIDYSIVTDMEAMNDEIDDNDNDSEAMVTEPIEGLWGGSGGWYINDAWEQLAMNQGWVRVGGATSLNATYLSGASAKAVWLAIYYLERLGKLGINVDIEISREHQALFVTLSNEMVDEFLRVGGRQADAYLTKLANS